MPSPSFSPEDSARVQVEALQRNDEPWGNHGIQTMYEFGEDVGGMDRSWYFGFQKDLYHFDHFLGMFWTRLGSLVNCQQFQLLESQPEGKFVHIKVQVTDAKGDDAGVYVFIMKQRHFGLKKGCWMTCSLTKQSG